MLKINKVKKCRTVIRDYEKQLCNSLWSKGHEKPFQHINSDLHNKTKNSRINNNSDSKTL